MSMPTRSSLSKLVGLGEWCEAHGFDVEDVTHEQATVTDREAGSVWWLYQVEAWLQIKSAVFEHTIPTQALCLSLLRLQCRLLGCRFGIEEDNTLCVLADVFPHEQTGEGVGAALTQMQWIVDCTRGLLRRVQETGIAADEDDINDAFESEHVSPLH
jgi:hypothetical protein